MSENEKRAQAASGADDDDDDDDAAQEQRDQQDQIIETGAVTPTKGKYVIHCLTIVGQIEGHYILPAQNKTTKYEHVIPQLVAIQENPEIQGLIIILNTVGGDVEAGLAIAELVSGMKKPTVSLVLGGGHSIGVPLAVSAQQSFIVPSATMTIHPVRMNGVVLGVPQTLSYFDKMQERIVRFVEDNSAISSGKFRELMMNTGELVMDVGTVLDGQQAVEAGLIDNLGGLSDAITCLYDLIEEQLPQKENEEDDKDKDKDKDKKSGGRQKDKKTGFPHDFSPALASPRGIAQMLKNEQRCKVKPVCAGRNRRRVNPGARVSSSRIRQKKAVARHTSGFSAHKLNGSGGDVCDVNPFGHSSPYAD